MMLNHAFLLYAHAYPSQLKEIIDLLSAPNHYFFINIDRKAKWGEEFINENRSSQIIFLENKDRMEIAHGGYSQIAVTLRLLSKAFNFKNAFISYFHLISGQDYPVRPNAEFDKFFEINAGKSFMHFDTQEEHDKWIIKKYPSRVKPFYFSDIQHRDNPVIDFFVHGLNFISKRFWIRTDIPNLYAGWNWFSWHRCVAEYVMKSTKTNTKFYNRFHFTSCADELIFHTLLHDHIRDLRIEPHNSLRYINWKKHVVGRSHQGSPLTLNEDEYEDIIKSGAFFCRKIDPIISKRLKEMLESNMLKSVNN